MKLNLGCGTFPFPLDRENVPNPEHTLPLPDLVFEPGWVNVDKHAAPGVQEQVNLFRFPWIRSTTGSPFNDNAADYIWASHIVEHVPHEVKVTRGLPPAMTAQYAAMVEELDGFFVFMCECWRILRPDGLLHVRFPYASSYPSLSDPTHTRYLTPGSFSYMGARQASTPFDYDIPAHFESSEPYTLRLRGEWVDRAQHYTPDGLMKMVRDDHSIADEIRMTFRAIKDGSAP